MLDIDCPIAVDNLVDSILTSPMIGKTNNCIPQIPIRGSTLACKGGWMRGTFADSKVGLRLSPKVAKIYKTQWRGTITLDDKISFLHCLSAHKQERRTSSEYMWMWRMQTCKGTCCLDENKDNRQHNFHWETTWLCRDSAALSEDHYSFFFRNQQTSWAPFQPIETLHFSAFGNVGTVAHISAAAVIVACGAQNCRQCTYVRTQ